MLFNSIEFAIFLPVVFLLYWFVLNQNLKLQNLFLVLVSYIFYGWWDWRFLSLIIISSIVDYLVGLGLGRYEKKNIRRLLLWTSIGVNIGILGVFKYYNFFIDSLLDLNPGLQQILGFSTLNIVLPVGISFYTFQTLSYSIDVYKRKIQPTTDVVSFFAFVSFFPQLVAGPIERASNLLPQFYRKRNFDFGQAVKGVRIIVWGLFKKIVIADNCAILVDEIFANYTTQSSLVLVAGMVLFAFQIYCDFSGYSDIAIGVSRLFGFDLMINFKYPYLSHNIADFWRRWHISLSTWFRDYVYIPLGGSRVNMTKSVRNVFIIFLVSGFWHGANWTFLMWGGIHALLFIPLFVTRKNKESGAGNNFLQEVPYIVLTFVVVCIAWVFFRAESIGMAFDYLARIYQTSSSGNLLLSTNRHLLILLIVGFNILFLMVVEAYYKRKNYQEVRLPTRYLLLVIMLICFMGAYKNHINFIYFQF